MTKGMVYLVGAGPGSADLITLRGLRAINSADVLIVDSLLPDNFSDELGVSVADKKVFCLKQQGIRMTQEQINQIMLESALNGKNVARIKTGDPHIFGKGLEEQTFLSEHNILWEYIPGISVLNAGLGLADMALTKRQETRSFAVVSARCSGGHTNLDLPKADSLIIFMGVSIIDKIVSKLLSQGWEKHTPAAILEKACMPFQKQVFGELYNIAKCAVSNNINAPAIFVIGPAALQYDFNGKRPTILFTGLDPANFRPLGKINHFPVIQIKENKNAHNELQKVLTKLQDSLFKYLVITSKISAKLFLKAIKESLFDCRVLVGVKIIVAGRGTAEILSEAYIKADVIPDDYGSNGILKQIKDYVPGNVLVVQSATATEAMANRISEKLGIITHLKLHEVVPNSQLPDKLPPYDIVYFTCPSAVRAFYQKYGSAGFKNKIWCIGDVTQKQLEKFNVNSEIVSPYVS